MKNNIYKHPQSGFASYLVITIFLVISLVVGIWLATHRFSWRSQADSKPQPNLVLQNKYLTGDQTSISLVNAQVYSSSEEQPSRYRLANAVNNGEPVWVEYDYPQLASPDSPAISLWHLDPVPGSKKVLLQFADQSGNWQEPGYSTSLTLTTPANPLSLSVQCLPDKTSSTVSLRARWDPAALEQLQAPFLWLYIYSSTGALVGENPTVDVTKGEYTFELPLLPGHFSLVGLPYLPNTSDRPLDSIKPLSYSEFTTSCDPKTLPTNISLQFNDKGGYHLAWTGQPGYSAIPLFAIEPGFQIYISADTGPNPFCGSCEVLFANVGDVRSFDFDNALSDFNPRPTATDQAFTKLISGRKYALTVTSGGYRIGDKITFTAK